MRSVLPFAFRLLLFAFHLQPSTFSLTTFSLSSLPHKHHVELLLGNRMIVKAYEPVV